VNSLIATPEFELWLEKLRDAKGKARILSRMDAAALGNFGDCESVGEGVSEMRIHVGPGYLPRVFHASRNVHLCASDRWRQIHTEARHQTRADNGAGVKSMTAKKAKAKKAAAGQLAPFDVSRHLDGDVVIAEYLAAALEDPNPDLFLRAVANVAKARGFAAVAEASGLGRESLYKALAPGAKVRYETVRKLVDSLGVKLTVTT
jgi:probable addiction module antidote protein/putative addiction module killer protein